MQQLKGGPVDAGPQGGLLDVLIILAENAKLLMGGSLAVGLLALAASFMLPQTYESVAVVQAEQPTASLMVTAAVLDPVIASLGLARDVNLEQARTRLQRQVKTSVGRTDKLLTLTVSARSPQQAQAIASAVIQRTFQESRPKGAVRIRLETQLAEARERFKNSQNVGESLRQRLEASGLPGANSVSNSEVARGYAELLGASSTAQTQIIALESQLEGLSEAQVIQSPTLPENPSKPKKGLVAIGATLATGLALLLFVFVRQSLKRTALNEVDSAKLLRIRKSFYRG